MDLSERYNGKRRWIRFFAEMVDRYFQDHVGRAAAALTYYMVFSFFPLLIFFSALLGFLHLPMLSSDGAAGLLLPEDVLTLINVYIIHVTESRSGSLLLVGFFFALWTPQRMVSSLMDFVNQAYRGEAEASPLRNLGTVFLFTLFVMIAICLVFGLLVLGEGVLEWVAHTLPLTEESISLWTKLRYLPMAGLMFGIVAALYYISPRPHPLFRHVWKGAAGVVVFWLLFSAAFSYYMNNLADYSRLYGSIGAVIILLLWLYFGILAILMGAEANHILVEMRKT